MGTREAERDAAWPLSANAGGYKACKFEATLICHRVRPWPMSDSPQVARALIYWRTTRATDPQRAPDGRCADDRDGAVGAIAIGSDPAGADNGGVPGRFSPLEMNHPWPSSS